MKIRYILTVSAMAGISLNGMHIMQRLTRPLSTAMRQATTRSVQFTKKIAKPLLPVTLATGAALAMTNRKKTIAQAQPTQNHSAIIELTSENIHTIVAKTDRPVIIDFSADWCQPCKTIKPLFDQLAQEGNYTCCTVDIDKSEDLASTYGITSVPAFVIIVDGAVKGTFSGAPENGNYESFKQKIMNTLNFDITKLSSHELNEKFFDAIRSGSEADVDACLRAGADINHKKNFDDSSLDVLTAAIATAPTVAVRTKMVARLLLANADPNATSEFEQGKPVTAIQYIQQCIDANKKTIDDYEKTIDQINKYNHKNA